MRTKKNKVQKMDDISGPKLNAKQNEDGTLQIADDLATALLSGGVYRASSVEDVPSLRLLDWCVYEAKGWNPEGTTRHFSGYCPEEGPGRASTAIVSYDPVTAIGTTQSGRRYRLVGPSGHNSDAAYVWRSFARANQLTEVKDVSAEYNVDNSQ